MLIKNPAREIKINLIIEIGWSCSWSALTCKSVQSCDSMCVAEGYHSIILLED